MAEWWRGTGLGLVLVLGGWCWVSCDSPEPFQLSEVAEDGVEALPDVPPVEVDMEDVPATDTSEVEVVSDAVDAAPDTEEVAPDQVEVDPEVFDTHPEDAVELPCDCPTAFTCCGAGHCVDLDNDSRHCGACDAACADSATHCVGGECVCREGTWCDDVGCVDLGTDARACGACGQRCGANQVCQEGECRCLAGYGDCDGRADNGCEVDLAYDQEHCGGCDSMCLMGQVCVAATCSGEWVNVHAAEFTMGSPSSEAGRQNDEAQWQALLSRPFAIQKTEVTQGQWRGLMGENPALFAGCGESCPVENVTWFSALAYANALSVLHELTPCYVLSGCSGQAANGTLAGCSVTLAGGVGKPYGCTGFRLPTEAEWEFAARAGSETAFSNGAITHTESSPLDPNLAAVGWYRGNAAAEYEGAQNCPLWFLGSVRCGPQPVGGKAANAWGLFDVHGNVWEWVWDWYGPYDTVGEASEPAGPATGAMRVARGGAWDAFAAACRSAYRFKLLPGQRAGFLGLRLVRSL